MAANAASLALLARAQRRERRAVARVAGEMKAAEALDGDDRAGRQQPHGAGDRVLAGPTAHERELRPAGRARGRLGVEAPVARRRVLGQAGRAERERREARACAVVGQRARDRVARSAVGAVRKRTAVAARSRIEDLGEAWLAGCRVVPDRRARVRAAAVDDRKTAAAGLGRALLDLDRVDARERRRRAPQPLEQRPQ
jgi:hypothetical protein